MTWECTPSFLNIATICSQPSILTISLPDKISLHIKGVRFRFNILIRCITVNNRKESGRKNSVTRPSGQRCVLKHFWAYPLTEVREMRKGNLSTAIATLNGRYARELFWCYSWLCMPSGSFLYIKLSISCIFHESITDRRTDGPTDGPTDGRTHPLIEMRGRI